MSEPTKEDEKKTETLADLRQQLSGLSETIKTIDENIADQQATRSKLKKEFRSIIGKIETRVAAGEK